jgi:predicted RND superfamily exporter protein
MTTTVVVLLYVVVRHQRDAQYLHHAQRVVDSLVTTQELLVSSYTPINQSINQSITTSHTPLLDIP